jgi:2'-5' RNA ligase
MSSASRLFLAVPIPSQIKTSICQFQRRLQTQIPQVRWAQADNLHLTMHFFGPTEQETLEKIKVSMLSVKGCQRSFQVEVEGLGAFPDQRRPRVIWLGLQPMDLLRQLHRNISGHLLRAGVVTEAKPYTPHLTIGRLRQKAPNLTDLFVSVGQPQLGSLKVDALTLFESHLHSGGAVHNPLITVTLDDETCDESCN